MIISFVLLLAGITITHLLWLILYPVQGGLDHQLDRGLRFVVSVLMWIVVWIGTSIFLTIHFN